jgi:hypothetical protein
LDPATGRPLQKKHAAAEPVAEPVSKPTMLVLGTRVPSGTTCPQSGVWTCEQPNAEGGSRRNFRSGETLPEVVVPVERSTWQKLKGAPARQVVQTMWTLEEIPGKDA